MQWLNALRIGGLCRLHESVLARYDLRLFKLVHWKNVAKDVKAIFNYCYEGAHAKCAAGQKRGVYTPLLTTFR